MSTKQHMQMVNKPSSFKTNCAVFFDVRHPTFKMTNLLFKITMLRECLLIRGGEQTIHLINVRTNYHIVYDIVIS